MQVAATTYVARSTVEERVERFPVGRVQPIGDRAADAHQRGSGVLADHRSRRWNWSIGPRWPDRANPTSVRRKYLTIEEALAMRILRALGDLFEDLSQGDPIALGIVGVVALTACVIAAIWIVDLRKRKNEKKKKPSEKRKSTTQNKPRP